MIVDFWNIERQNLISVLTRTETPAETAEAVRHSIRQTEQNTLAELSDPQLRQQAGMLFGCLRSCMAFLEVQSALTVWEAQQTSSKKKLSAWWIAFAVLAMVLGLYCYLKGINAAVWITAGMFLCGCGAFISTFRSASPLPKDELRIVLKVNSEHLLALLDAQMRTMDRMIDDFGVLNDQLRTSPDTADLTAASRAADLLEALYEYSGDERLQAEEAANRLLASLGLKAVPYSEEQSALFTILPSKNTVRTLSPAIVSAKENRLLKRGTAAVPISAA